jgi:hypothetical protein
MANNRISLDRLPEIKEYILRETVSRSLSRQPAELREAYIVAYNRSELKSESVTDSDVYYE